MKPPARRLWEYDEGLAGEDGDPRGGSDIIEPFDSFDELAANVRRFLGPLNMPYSWHWFTPDSYSPPEETEELVVNIAQAYRTVGWSCPISRDQEPRVRELLAECAAFQKQVWAAVADGAR